MVDLRLSASPKINLSPDLDENPLSFNLNDTQMENWLLSSRQENTNLITSMSNSSRPQSSQFIQLFTPRTAPKAHPKTSLPEKTLRKSIYYPGVKRKEDYIEDLVSKLKSYTKVKDPKELSHGNNKKSNFILTKCFTAKRLKRLGKPKVFKPIGSMLIKTLEPEYLFKYRKIQEMKKSKEERSRLIFAESMGMERKIESVRNNAEIKVNSRKIEFTSPGPSIRSRKIMKKKPFKGLLMINTARSEDSLRNLSYSGKSPLVIRSFSPNILASK